MSDFKRCDQCAKEDGISPPGWFRLPYQPRHLPLGTVLIGHSADLCSWECIAGFASKEAALNAAAHLDSPTVEGA